MAELIKSNDTQVGGDHYRSLEPQPWDVICAWNLGVLEGNIVKYVARWAQGKGGRIKGKGGLEDLRKARHYLEKLIEHELKRG